MTNHPTPERPEPEHTIADDAAATAAGAGLPERIGGFRIIRRLGEGGMGAVFEAQQDSPRRIVALKVVNVGIASEAMLRRFEHEAHYLARLQHPGIAQVYEAGTFDSGRGRQPWFAMELVRGEPLNKYAAAKNLDLRARLGLIVRICQAVHHAHQKGVIHRDLKPDNILVTEDGDPKILDFGVARATDSDLQVTTIQTDIGQLIGTIPYMSPEQAGGNPEDLDTRSDVYALGVIAYELLAGRLPYDLRQRMIHEAVRIIREEEPTRLSSISRTLRGDVEIIIGKALEKEKDRRYQSASDLASDIEHYLNDEPIEARPPSTAYQLRKFARRNRALVGGVAATFVALTGGLIAALVLLGQMNAARAAEAQRADELEQVAAFQESQLADIETELMGIRLRRGILDTRRSFLEARGTEEEAINSALTELEQSLTGVNFTNIALETLDENIFERALNAIDEQFADQPLIRARLLQTVADAMSEVGLLNAALSPQTEALELRRRLLGGENSDTLTSIDRMAHLLQASGQYDDAMRNQTEVLEVSRRILGDTHPDTLAAINNTGALLKLMGRPNEAMAYMQESLQGRRHVLGDEHPDTLVSLANMGGLLQSMSRFDEAEPYLRESLDVSRRVLGDEHPETLASINNMGSLLSQMSRWQDALPYYTESLDVSRRTLGDAHPDTLDSINNMGYLLQSMGRWDEAKAYLREALDSTRRVLGEQHPSTLTSINNMGYLLESMKSYEEAMPYFLEALEGRRRILGDEHPSTLTSINNVGALLLSMGRYEDAMPYLNEVLALSRRVHGDEHHHTITALGNMGALLERIDRKGDAAIHYRESLELSRRVFGNQHVDTVISIHNLGGFLRDLGQLEEAEQLGREAVDNARVALPQGHWRTGVFLSHHARTLAAMKRFAESELRALEAYGIFEAALGPTHGRAIVMLRQLVDLYTAWHAAEPDAGHDAKAAQWQARLDEISAPAESDGP